MHVVHAVRIRARCEDEARCVNEVARPVVEGQVRKVRGHGDGGSTGPVHFRVGHDLEEVIVQRHDERGLLAAVGLAQIGYLVLGMERRIPAVFDFM